MTGALQKLVNTQIPILRLSAAAKHNRSPMAVRFFDGNYEG
jgi:hypothetical protein